MRRTIIAFLFLAACSKRCGTRESVREVPEASPVATSSPTETIAAPEPTTTSAPLAWKELPPVADFSMPDACLDIEADFEWRFKIACRANSVCNEQFPKPADNLTPDDITFDSGAARGTWSNEAPDLNGDGIKEIVKGFGLTVSEGEEHLYAGGNAACAVHLAKLDSSNFKVLSTRHDGWADISIEDGSFCQGVNACGCKAATSIYEHGKDGYEQNVARFVMGKMGHCP